MTDNPNPDPIEPETQPEHPLATHLRHAAEFPIESEDDFDTINNALLTCVNIGDRLMARGLELAEQMRTAR